MTSTPRLRVVALGPGPYDLLSVRAARLLERAERVLVRDLAHPSIESAPPPVRWVTLEQSGQGVESEPADARLLAAVAQHARLSGGAVFAVAGSVPLLDPLVSELVAAPGDLQIELVPSFALAASSGGQAPRQQAAKLQILTAAETEELNPLQAALLTDIGGEGTPGILTRLRRLYPSEHRVSLIEATGDLQAVRGLQLVQLAEISKQPANYSLFLPPVGAEQAPGSPLALRRLVHRLRAPGGCPWDREQTPASLIRYVIEEAYEVVEAIEHETPEQVADELGDLLLQVYLQAEIAEEQGQFSFADVVRSIGEKLVRRHPHVFAGLAVADAREVERNWEQIKRAEKGTASGDLLKEIPRSLPALSQAQALQRKLAKRGFDWHGDQGVYEKLDEELAELKAARGDRQSTESELGDVLFMLAKLATNGGLDAERALRGAIQRVTERYAFMSKLAADRKLRLEDLDLEAQLDLWREAKEHQRGRGARI